MLLVTQGSADPEVPTGPYYAAQLQQHRARLGDVLKNLGAQGQVVPAALNGNACKVTDVLNLRICMSVPLADVSRFVFNVCKEVTIRRIAGASIEHAGAARHGCCRASGEIQEIAVCGQDGPHASRRRALPGKPVIGSVYTCPHSASMNRLVSAHHAAESSHSDRLPASSPFQRTMPSACAATVSSCVRQKAAPRY